VEFRQGFLTILDELWSLINLRKDRQHFRALGGPDKETATGTEERATDPPYGLGSQQPVAPGPFVYEKAMRGVA
jgi:hypothetical protein